MSSKVAKRSGFAEKMKKVSESQTPNRKVNFNFQISLRRAKWPNIMLNILEHKKFNIHILPQYKEKTLFKTYNISNSFVESFSRLNNIC